MISRIEPLHSLCLVGALAWAVLAPAHAAWVTYADATGWNEDIIYGKGETGPAITASLDSGPGSTAGASLYGYGAAGLTITGSGVPDFTQFSFTGSGSSMQFQPFDHQDNALMLTPGESGFLDLAFPSAMTSLALYGLSGNGSVTGQVIVHYADLSSQAFALGAIGQDWFDGSSVAYVPFARENQDGTFEVDGENPRIYEQLYATTSSSPVVSIEVRNTGLIDGDEGNLAVMAISGNAVPEPSALLSLSAAVALAFLRRRRH